VCVAHLYGDVLYYATSLFNHYVNGISYSRPEVLYFWVYYFFMNFVWIVVPAGEPFLLRDGERASNKPRNAGLLYSSVCTVSNALRAAERIGVQKKAK
jgi:hypothetical protein